MAVPMSACVHSGMRSLHALFTFSAGKLGSDKMTNLVTRVISECCGGEAVTWPAMKPVERHSLMSWGGPCVNFGV